MTKELSKYEQMIKNISLDEFLNWELEGIFPPSLNKEEYEEAKKEYFKNSDKWFDDFIKSL